jgi:hypothetical protein
MNWFSTFQVVACGQKDRQGEEHRYISATFSFQMRLKTRTYWTNFSVGIEDSRENSRNVFTEWTVRDTPSMLFSRNNRNMKISVGRKRDVEVWARSMELQLSSLIRWDASSQCPLFIWMWVCSALHTAVRECVGEWRCPFPPTYSQWVTGMILINVMQLLWCLSNLSDATCWPFVL